MIIHNFRALFVDKISHCYSLGQWPQWSLLFTVWFSAKNLPVFTISIIFILIVLRTNGNDKVTNTGIYILKYCM